MLLQRGVTEASPPGSRAEVKRLFSEMTASLIRSTAPLAYYESSTMVTRGGFGNLGFTVPIERGHVREDAIMQGRMHTASP